MNVTKENFPSVLRSIGAFINSSSFIAIDAEMTGISDSRDPETFYDSPFTSFRKKVSAAQKFGLIQVGICLFEDTAPNKTSGSFAHRNYITRPYNFYVFPSSEPSLAKFSKAPTLDPEAIVFNRRHGMDFQKWICNGVGYCDAAHEDAYRQLIKEKHLPKMHVTLRDDAQRKKADNIISLIKSWSEDNSSDKDFIVPEAENHFMRNYIEALVQETACINFLWRGGSWIATKTAPRVAEYDIEEKVINYVGFREIYRLLSKAKKPIVGHNCLSDLLFLIDSMDHPIGHDPHAFRAFMSTAFPSVWDTKILSVSSPEIENRFNRISLQRLFDDYITSTRHRADTNLAPKSINDTILGLPGLEFPLGFDKYTGVLKRCIKGIKNASFAHEAAYDAMCTGFVFLNMCAELPENIINAKKNHLALFKNFHLLNLNNENPLFSWIPKGYVFKLKFTRATNLDAAASIQPFKGRVDWIENGTAAVVVDDSHSSEEILAHYKGLDSDFTIEQLDSHIATKEIKNATVDIHTEETATTTMKSQVDKGCSQKRKSIDKRDDDAAQNISTESNSIKDSMPYFSVAFFKTQFRRFI